MAKRNKVKVASKSRKSALRVEALEQRQLLAAVTGGGTEVGTNIVHSNGNVYDQVLMTGSSVTVTADPGQVTRVSFLDLSGDIVQAEFSGQGTLTITLDQFGAAAPAANYNQPGVNYVSGLATFTIQDANADTNFGVFTVGSATAVNQALFEGGKTGGNNVADIAALRIVADPQNPGGFSTFGGIRAGNAVFAAASGTVGISAALVNVQGPVIIGDIDASHSGVPTLNFGGNSQFSTLTLSGGDLAQTNGNGFVGGNFTTINATDGASSAGTLVGSKVVNAAAAASLSVTAVTLDTASSIDLTGATQSQIDNWFTGRTFTNALTVMGDLSAVNNIVAADFRGGVTFTGDLNGPVTVTAGDIASLTAQKNVAAAITAAGGDIGDVNITGNLSHVIGARNIGNVSITGNLTGGLTTDVLATLNAYDAGEGKIGNVSVTGNISGTGWVEGILGIGNIMVTGNITSTGSQGGVFTTRSGTTGDAFVANIGTLQVTGVIDQGGTANPLIKIDVNGTFGDVTVNGTGSSSGATQIGAFVVDGSLGTATSTTGTISITETASSVEWGGLTVGSAVGTVSPVTITGAGTTSATFDLNGPITATGVASVGAINVTGFQEIEVNNAINAKLAPLTFTTNAGTTAANAVIQIDADIGSFATDLGVITLNAGTANSRVSFNADIIADDMNDVNITAATINLGDLNQGGLKADNTVGNISLMGMVNVSGAAVDLGTKATASFTTTGATTLAPAATMSFGRITGALTLEGATVGPLAQVLARGDVGSLVLNGTTNLSAAAGTSFLLNDSTSATDDLGSLTVNGRIIGAAGIDDIRASSIGNISISSTLTQDQSLVKDLGVLAAPNAHAVASLSETVVVNGSNLASYGIGNIAISSSLALAFTGTALFEGDNQFVALGKIGNIDVTGAVAGAQQSRMFKAATDAAWFAVGDVDGLVNNTTAAFGGGDGLNVPVNTSGAVVALDYTAGSVSVGNVTVNAQQTITTAGYSGVDGISGSNADAGMSLEGFAVLSGARVVATDGDLIALGLAGATAVNAARIDAQLGGTIGNILIASNNAVGFRDAVTVATLAGTAQEQISGIIAATGVGTQQAVASSGSTVSGFAAIIGDVNAVADATVEVAPDSTNQIVVVVI